MKGGGGVVPLRPQLSPCVPRCPRDMQGHSRQDAALTALLRGSLRTLFSLRSLGLGEAGLHQRSHLLTGEARGDHGIDHLGGDAHGPYSAAGRKVRSSESAGKDGASAMLASLSPVGSANSGTSD